MGKRIIIIGAGVAGLSAAMSLAKAGFNVDVFESRNIIGGRFFSFTDKQSGEIIDNGQHLFSGAYKEFFAILNELGTSVYVKSEGKLKVPFADNNGKRFILDTSSLPGSLGFAHGLMRFSALSFDSKIKLFNFFIKVKKKKIKADDLTCLELLNKEKQNPELIRIFWTPLILAVMNTKPESVAATLLIEVLERAFFAGGKDSELFLSTVPASTLFNPFKKWIQRHNGELHLQSSVRQLIIENDKATGIILKNGEKHFADAVISTVQPYLLKQLLKTEIKESEIKFLSKFTYSPIINIYYRLDKHIKTDDFIALLGTQSQWMFNLRNFMHSDKRITSSSTGLINVTISGGNDIIDLPQKELVAKCFDELKQNVKEFSNAEIIHTKVIKDKFATFEATPEALSMRLNSLTGIKNLYLAGDWTDTGLPATLESAAISGRIAANSIIQQHK